MKFVVVRWICNWSLFIFNWPSQHCCVTCFISAPLIFKILSFALSPSRQASEFATTDLTTCTVSKAQHHYTTSSGWQKLRFCRETKGNRLSQCDWQNANMLPFVNLLQTMNLNSRLSHTPTDTAAGRHDSCWLCCYAFPQTSVFQPFCCSGIPHKRGDHSRNPMHWSISLAT